MTCWNCHQEVNVRRCTRCLEAAYCSTNCQRQHWSKHKGNCIPQNLSLHSLFEACRMDVFPTPPVRCDYGFDNMQLYHGDLVSPEGLSAETILLGLYQVTLPFQNNKLSCWTCVHSEKHLISFYIEGQLHVRLC